MSPSWQFEKRGSILLVVALGAVALGARVANSASLLALVDDVRNEGKNRVDQGRMVQGYYQGLNEVDVEARGGLAERLAHAIVEGQDGPRWATQFSATGGSRQTKEGYLLTELVPGAQVEHIGVPVSINRWGQRDRDYELEKPDGTFRIALIGSSNSMGWGVRVEEGYVEIVEERLNREWAGRGPYRRYEILNFSAPGFSAPEFIYVAEELAPRFAPDMLLLEGCAEEYQFNVAERVASRLQKKRDLRYDFMRRLVESAGVSGEDALFRLKRRIMPLNQAIVRGCYEHLGNWSRNTGTPVALALLRLEISRHIHPLLEWGASVAEECGLIPLGVYEAFAGGDKETMYLANERDHHPSAKAHALLADDLYNQLLNDPRTRKLLVGDAVKPNEGF